MQRSVKAALFTAALAVVLVSATLAAAQPDKRLDIGWTAWSDAEFVTKLAGRILERRLDYDVSLTLADISVQYRGVAEGDLDAMLMAWLPSTHANYMQQFGNEVVNLGVLYTGARLGWVVPAHIPEDALSSIEDLRKPEVRERLGGRVQGIDASAGLMRLSRQALERVYELDYELVAGSGASMTAALGRAIERGEWIVVTGWSPHWKFGRWELRYLEDPRGALGGLERVHALARKGLYQDSTDAAAFLARMHIPLEHLQAGMFDAQQTSYEAAVDRYIREHPRRVAYWVTGDIDG